jgi:hypothetical protein
VHLAFGLQSSEQLALQVLGLELRREQAGRGAFEYALEKAFDRGQRACHGPPSLAEGPLNSVRSVPGRTIDSGQQYSGDGGLLAT